MSSQSIKVLLIEDNAGDAHLIKAMLAGANDLAFELDWVQRLSDGLGRLKKTDVDVVLLDLSLPDSQGFETFVKIQAHSSHVPVLLLTGNEDETLASKAVQSGAQDYLSKNQLDEQLLGRAIRYSIERMHAQHALRDSEERYRRLVELLPDGIVVNIAGEIVFANSAALEILGASDLEQLLDRNIYNFVHPDYLKLVQQRMKKLQAGESALPIEEKFIRLDGDLIDVEVASISFDFQGKRAVLSLIRDITARKQVELELKQRATQLEIINDIGSKIAAVLNLDTLLRRAARLAQEAFGYHHVAIFLKEDTLLRLKAVAGAYKGHFSPGHTQKLSEGINGWVVTHSQKIVANDVSREARYTSLIAEHSITQSELCLPITVADMTVGVLDIQSPQLNAFSENDVMVMETLSNQIAIAIENARLFEQAQQEIAERRQAEEALRYSEQRFRRVVTSITDHIYMTEVANDGRHINLYLSPDIEELTGYPMQNFVDDWSFWPSVVIHPQDREVAAAQAARLAEGHDSEIEYRLVRANGQVIWVRDSARVEITENSKIVYGVVADVTQQKRAQEEMVRLYVAERERYQEAEALRQAALALVSTIDLSQVIERILVELQNVVPYDSATIRLLEKDHLTVIGGRGLADQTSITGASLPASNETPAALVLTSSKPIIVSDIAQQYGLFQHEAYLTDDAKSWLGVPLAIGLRVIGMLALDKKEIDFYTDSHAKTASAYAAQAAIAIENARLHAETEQRAQQLAVMHQLDRAISASLNIEDVYQAFSEHTGRLLAYDRMSIVLLKEDRLRVSYVAGLDEPAVGAEIPLKGTTSEWVIANKKPLLIGHIDAEEFSSQVSWAPGLQSVIVLPLQVKRQTIGTWNIGSIQPDFYSAEDLKIAQSIADQLALGIENARLYRQAQQEIAERKQAQELLEAERALLAQRVQERTAELSAANAQLARAARLKDEFLANMSHELRTPLNAILGMAEVLRMNVYGPLNGEQENALYHIEESGRHLLDLINDILDLSKIEAGKLELVIGPVLVNDVCQASLRFIKQIAQKKKIKVSSEVDEEVGIIQGDQRRIKQILVNLLSNAVKFTPEGGQVGLEVKGNRAQQVVNFTVWDTGIGISGEEMRQLFKPFVQIDSSLSRQHEGTGLGLSLVSRLTEMHQGGVSVESEVGRGSRFTVSLPWRVAGSQSSKVGESATAEPALEKAVDNNLQPAYILLAEDNEVNIETLRDFLKVNGHNIIEARNGLEAIERAKKERPDLILMDIQMPEMDGLEAIRRLKADETTRHIPIIALTALAMPGDRERCLAAGANEYLSKPVKLAQLLQLIQSQLGSVPNFGNRQGGAATEGSTPLPKGHKQIPPAEGAPNS